MPTPAPKPDEDHPDLKPGDVVAGRFRIVELIGSGGFSVVYRAHQERMNRFVALKVLKPTASSDQKLVERFRREALFASQLSHPNTITLFDYGQTDDGLCYIAMEYLVGHDLSEELTYREPVEPNRVWSILAQSCRSLAEAHGIGLIHRDLKPENIFIANPDEREFVKVLDFGVSKALSDFQAPDASSLAPLTQEGTVFGTPLYMAPEQAMAEELTAGVDVYALGHLGYEMLTGAARYSGETSPMDVMLKQINDPPLELPDPLSDTPFAPLLREATRKDPEQRISDAGQMLQFLMDDSFAEYMDSTTLAASTVPTGEHPSLQLPSASTEPGSPSRASKKIYRWELSVLQDELQQVRQSAAMRLIVIHGNPGAGRSNLLRAFLKRHRDESGTRVVHRHSYVDDHTANPGLEADLAEAAGLPLEGGGITEITRLLNELPSGETSALSDITPLRIDSEPLARLASQRDDFFTRLVEPFRRAARVGTLVWGIENLENVDPMTLAFLERFIREMRVHPTPVLLVVTVHQDSLVRRPGLMRYAEEIINAPSSFARHLHLADPDEIPEPEDSAESAVELADIPSDADVDGSYSGVSPSLPEQLAPSDSSFDKWAALADGASAAEPVASAAAPGADDPEDRRADQADTGPTQRMELFTTEETTTDGVEGDDTAIHRAFDVVLGYLAQLDDHLVNRELWEFVYPRVLPIEVARMMNSVLEYAEQFGILQLSAEAIGFTDRDFAAALRENFSNIAETPSAHAELAELLVQFDPEPSRDTVRRIVHHAVKGEDYERAVDLLLRAGDKAYEQQDLDLSREFYLQFQTLLEELSTHSPPPPVTSRAYPKEWLRIGEIQGAVGEYGAAEDALRRAIRESKDDDHRLQASAHKLLGDLAMAQRRYDHAREYFEAGGELYQQTSLARPFVASRGEVARCSMRLGRPRRAEGTLLEALDKAQKLQDLPLQARLHRYMGEVLTRQARFLEAVEHLERAQQLFEQQGDYRSVVHCLDELGQAHFAAGQFSKARDLFTRALARMSSRHIQLSHSPHLGLARSLAAVGDLDQAEVHLVEAMSHFTTRNQPAQRARVQLHLGDLYLAENSPEMADEHYEHVFETGEAIGHRRMAFDALVRRGYAAFDDERYGDCFSLLSDAVEFAEGTDDRHGQLMARSHLIYLQLVQHDFQAKGAMFSSLLTELDERDIQPPHILCDLFRADIAAARGSLRQAMSLLDQTRQHVAHLGEYPLFIPIARREFHIGARLDQSDYPDPGDGHALGALLAPEAGRRLFDDSRVR